MKHTGTPPFSLRRLSAKQFPGLKYLASMPEPNTMTSEARREDGSIVGGMTTVVSADGASKTVTNFGYDAQLRQFKQKTVWDRQ